MTSSEIRESFLNFFKSKGHTLVPSSSLLPDSPNLLFTNAGMNQFVPIFLGQRAPDVNKWPGAVPGSATRAADTQKCIRAGGKHNDLEDVGLDTYHHTFFEMLGNWSFGDYFKNEAIEWAWELVAGIWKFPKNRLYATVYKPGPGDPAEFDQEAYDKWAQIFTAAGLDPKIHIQFGGKKDNFWMMGDTGPCGPCSEIHVDLTPQGDTQGKLVNVGTAECIEIWNLVFIQFNANPDGSFSPLPARHVDTGMGFERVTGIMQCTKNFTDFSRVVSNYETDVFRPIFDKLERLSGKRYGSTLPAAGTGGKSEQEKIDVAFRVIADHIRTLSFAIADGIQPGNNGRNYVLRRILRRAVKYGRTLGFHEPFFYNMVDVLVENMGGVFPELRAKQQNLKNVIRVEEETFNDTLDAGIQLFDQVLKLQNEVQGVMEAISPVLSYIKSDLGNTSQTQGAQLALLKRTLAQAQRIEDLIASIKSPLWDRFQTGEEIRLLGQTKSFVTTLSAALDPALGGVEINFSLDNIVVQVENTIQEINAGKQVFRGNAAFILYDTYGFPLDLTELMAREAGLEVDTPRFRELMEHQKERGRAAQKKTIIELSQIESAKPTQFVGYDKNGSTAKVLEVVRIKDKTAVILDATSFYAESGGQVGDRGEIVAGGQFWPVVDTVKSGNIILHLLPEEPEGLAPGTEVQVSVDAERRRATMRHHTVTHLLHWALHQVVSPDAAQKGSYVGPDKLTFDFNSVPLTPEQVRDVEKLVNERILENASVSWQEIPYAEAKNRKEIMQFFGEKYGDRVRVLQIGGRAGEFNGYSMELCGGTHVRATGEIGLFRIVGESAIQAGVRRIEAVAGLRAYERMREEMELLGSVATKVNSPVGELEKKLDSLLAQHKELEKQLKAAQQKQAADFARTLLAKAQTIKSTPAIIEDLGAGDGDYLQGVVDALKGQFKGVVVLAGAANNAVTLVATVSADLTKTVQAGKIIQAIAPIVGGKGGGRPDNARGGGKDTAKVAEALAKAKSLLP